MAQVTVYLPDDVYAAVQERRRRGENVNLSAVCAGAVQAWLNDQARLEAEMDELAALEASGPDVGAERDWWLAHGGASWREIDQEEAEAGYDLELDHGSAPPEASVLDTER
ncbi:MAG: hypothetical protein ACRDI2_11500 [Chloroflexota bacterium]